MFLKLVLFAGLLAMVSGQTISSCSYLGNFTFYSNYNESASPTEFMWDWMGLYFNDGTNDAFDGYFYTSLSIDGESYPVNTSIPVDFDCDVGSTDVNSFSVATYTYNVTSKVQIRRQFYAPRKVAMMRIVDEIINHGAEATFSVTYSGEYGSDEDTVWSEVTKYYWVSNEGADGTDGYDPPISVNAASIGGAVAPVKGINEFIDGEDTTSWSFVDFVVPAGESRSLMTIVAMHRLRTDASELAQSLNTMPNAIYDNFPTPFESVLNWGLCSILIEQVVPQTTFCTTPASTTFQVTGAEASISFNGSPVTLSSNQFSVSLASGENKIQYTRSADACSAQTVTLNFKVPAANLTFSVDTSGDLPRVSAAGGFGDYEFTWKFNGGGDLNEAFGAKATAMVTDKEGCAASIDIDVPELLESKVSSAAQLIPLVSLVGLVMAF